MSMISQSTQDSGSTSIDNSDSRFNFRARSYDSLDSVQQRLDYSKAIPEVQHRKLYVEKPLQINYKNKVIIGVAASLLIALFIGLMSVINFFPTTNTDSHQHAIAHHTSEKTLSKLLDPVKVNYIKSYEESAMGKFYYWDLLAEKYFNMIVEKLKQVVWMEEKEIEKFFDNQFSESDSFIIKKKVWRLRDKCKEIEVTTNLDNHIIWRYKNCFCV